MHSQKDILEFLTANKIALAGVSRDKNHFSRMVLHRMLQGGYELFPVNPGAEEIEGLSCYPSVVKLPEHTNHLIILTNKKDSAVVVKEALEKGIPNIWLAQGSESPEAIQLLKQGSSRFIIGECIFMWLKPVGGLHQFHRFLHGLFGKMPPLE